VWQQTSKRFHCRSLGSEVCTGFLEHEGDPHLKRLEVPNQAAHFEFVTLPPSTK